MVERITQDEDSPRHPKGHQPAPFAREVDKAKVRKQHKRDRVAHLIVDEKLTQAQVAERMGISPRWVNQLWREAVVAARGEDLSSEEIKQQVRTRTIAALEHALHVASDLVEESASYGAVVVAASKQLLEMHGAQLPDSEDEGLGRKSIEDVAERVGKHSPLLLARWQRAEEKRLGAKAKDEQENSESAGVAG